MNRLQQVSVGTRSKRPGLLVPLLASIYLVSGACSLIDEVIWTRLLKLSLGNTVYASSTVISVFMAGLALGAWLMAKRCQRWQRPLLVYAVLELSITLMVLISPGLLQAGDRLYVWAWNGLHPGASVAMGIQVVIAAGVLLLPTLLMGSSLPLLAQVVTAAHEQTGLRVGLLYALNTLGAALGCYLAGFVLIRWLGVWQTLYLSAALNGGVALAAGLLHWRYGQRLASEPVAVSSQRLMDGSRKPRVLALSFFLSGAACIGYEVIWMRSIVHGAGAFTYVFSGVLTVYLFGNVIGTEIGRRLLPRIRQPEVAYAVVFFALGLFGVLYLPWLQGFNVTWLGHLYEPFESYLKRHGLESYSLIPLIQCVILFLIPSFLMGLGFPWFLQAWSRHMPEVGQATGWAYSLNTWGGVVGGLLTGFVLLPRWGVQSSSILWGVAVVWMAAGVWYQYLTPRCQVRLRRSLLWVAAACVTMQSLNIPTDLFHRTVALSKPKLNHELVDVREGINTTVSIHRHPERGDLYLYTSGNMVAGTSRGYRGDQKMLGHLPLLLNAQAQKTLSVGFGVGESTACIARHGIEQIDCVEIAPEVVELSKLYFSQINLGDRLEERVNMIYMDARNYLHVTQECYDAIISDCTSIRGFAENSSLYTREYFECAKHHLNDQGLFMAWIDTHSTEAPSMVDSLIGTVLDVFPHVTLWYPMPEPAPFFVIVGSEHPQQVSVRHLQDVLANPEVMESLAQIHMVTVEDILSCYLGDEQDLRRYLNLKDYQVNSDNHPFIEFCTEEPSVTYAAARAFYRTIRSDSILSHIDWTDVHSQDRQACLARAEQWYGVGNYILWAETSQPFYKSLKYCRDGLEMMPGNRALLTRKRMTETKLLEAGIKALYEDNTQNALDIAAEIIKFDPDSPKGLMLLSQVNLFQGDRDRAIASARKALENENDNLSLHYNLWSILMATQDESAAHQALQAAMEVSSLETRQVSTAFNQLGF